MSLIKLDGVGYNVGEVGVIKRSFDIQIDSVTAGLLMDGSEVADAIATRESFDVTVEPRGGDKAQYDAFVEDLTAPKSPRVVTLPYAQGEITFAAKITSVSDVLRKAHNGNRFGGIQFTVTQLKPRRVVG